MRFDVATIAVCLVLAAPARGQDDGPTGAELAWARAVEGLRHDEAATGTVEVGGPSGLIDAATGGSWVALRTITLRLGPWTYRRSRAERAVDLHDLRPEVDPAFGYMFQVRGAEAVLITGPIAPSFPFPFSRLYAAWGSAWESPVHQVTPDVSALVSRQADGVVVEMLHTRLPGGWLRRLLEGRAKELVAAQGRADCDVRRRVGGALTLSAPDRRELVHLDHEPGVAIGLRRTPAGELPTIGTLLRLDHGPTPDRERALGRAPLTDEEEAWGQGVIEALELPAGQTTVTRSQRSLLALPDAGAELRVPRALVVRHETNHLAVIVARVFLGGDDLRERLWLPPMHWCTVLQLRGEQVVYVLCAARDRGQLERILGAAWSGLRPPGPVEAAYAGVQWTPGGPLTRVALTRWRTGAVHARLEELARSGQVRRDAHGASAWDAWAGADPEDAPALLELLGGHPRPVEEDR